MNTEQDWPTNNDPMSSNLIMEREEDPTVKKEGEKPDQLDNKECG